MACRPNIPPSCAPEPPKKLTTYATPQATKSQHRAFSLDAVQDPGRTWCKKDKQASKLIIFLPVFVQCLNRVETLQNKLAIYNVVES